MWPKMPKKCLDLPMDMPVARHDKHMRSQDVTISRTSHMGHHGLRVDILGVIPPYIPKERNLTPRSHSEMQKNMWNHPLQVIHTTICVHLRPNHHLRPSWLAEFSRRSEVAPRPQFHGPVDTDARTIDGITPRDTLHVTQKCSNICMHRSLILGIIGEDSPRKKL